MKNLFSFEEAGEDLKVCDVLYPRRIFGLGVGAQIFVIAFLFVLYTIVAWFDVQRTGMMFGYPVKTSTLFVPIYEEVLFRGLILFGLLRFYSPKKALIVTSILFGIWHLKNIFFLSPPHLAYQIFYAGILFGPIVGYIALRARTIWIGVILHYLNNLMAPLFAVLFAWMVSNRL